MGAPGPMWGVPSRAPSLVTPQLTLCRGLSFPSHMGVTLYTPWSRNQDYQEGIF